MGIETEALDLCLQMADACTDDGTKRSFLRIADEEKAHMATLSAFLEEKEAAGQSRG